jgi:sugar lactone lactonase YvrE
MLVSRLKHLVAPAITIALLAGCGGGSPSPTLPAGSSSAMLPGSHLSPGARAKRNDLLPCTSVQASSGVTYTVAHLGGGNNLDVESSAYANCDIGIYISTGHGPYRLNQSVVNGSFLVGVYLDGAGRRILDTSICVNGENGGSCASGSSSSPGTGVYAQNTPNLRVNTTHIDGYAAGFASGPCPNANNYMGISHSTVTNSAYPWSFQGGNVTTKKDSPTPSVGGSCAGSGIGTGAPNVYVADTNNNAVKEILAVGGYTTVNTLGSGFSYPVGVAVDASGNVYVADAENSAVKEIVAAGGYTTVNTLGSGFNFPEGVAVDASDNVYVADSGHTAVKEILAAGGYTTVNTLGSGFSDPTGVAVDANDNVYVADSGHNAVKEILAVGGYTTVNTLGSGFSDPGGVAVDASDNVYVADSNNNAVKEILAAGGYTTVNTLGSGFLLPFAVAVDANDNVYVADADNNAVKEILAAGGYTTVNTLGSGFFRPAGVAVYNPSVQGLPAARRDQRRPRGKR